MKKVIRYVDEDTLEIKEKEIEVKDEKEETDNVTTIFEEALNCDVYEFSQAYEKYKNAEKEFNKLYEPFKDRLINLYQQMPDLPKTIIVGDSKITYVSPSVRKSIDTKKLKEEEPSLAAKYTKLTNVNASVRITDLLPSHDEESEE